MTQMWCVCLGWSPPTHLYNLTTYCFFWQNDCERVLWEIPYVGMWGWEPLRNCCTLAAARLLLLKFLCELHHAQDNAPSVTSNLKGECELWLRQDRQNTVVGSGNGLGTAWTEWTAESPSPWSARWGNDMGGIAMVMRCGGGTEGNLLIWQQPVWKPVNTKWATSMTNRLRTLMQTWGRSTRLESHSDVYMSTWVSGHLKGCECTLTVCLYLSSRL